METTSVTLLLATLGVSILVLVFRYALKNSNHKNGCPLIDLGAEAKIEELKHVQITELHRVHGPTFCVKSGAHCNVFVLAPEDIKQVLTAKPFSGKINDTHDQDKETKGHDMLFNVSNLVKPLYKNSVFDMATGPDQVKLRASLAPAFGVSSHRLRSLMRKADTAVSQLPNAGPTDTYDLRYWALTSCESFAGAYATGNRMAWGPQQMKVFADATRHFETRYAVDGTAPVSDDDRAAMRGMYNEVFPVVEKAMADPAADAADCDGTDALSLLLKNNNQYDAGYITDTIVNLFTAGAESPAASLWYTLSHLSRNKEVSAKVIAEADAFFAKHTDIDDMTIDDLNDLPYIKNVVLEGLRRFAPATKVQRGCVEEVTVGGFKWLAGTNFGICIESVNRDTSAWADPTSFSPERYDTPVPGNNRFTYATFSHGKRGCPGRATTVLQMQVLLVNLFRRYTLAPTAGDETQDIETRPCVKKWVRWDVGGHTLLIQPRTPTVSSQAA